MFWLIIVLILLILYLLWCCRRVSKWITLHQPWLAGHHARGAKLEEALCRLEEYAYRNPIDPALVPPPADRFCEIPNTPPDGFGGNPPPDGF